METLTEQAGNPADNVEKLRRVRAVLLDMDGVLYVGNRPLPGVQELLDYLDQTGRQWLCVTNNSSRTSQTFSEKLAGMNIQVPPQRILGSAEATANWLAEQARPGARVIMMGEASLRQALADKGFQLVDDPFQAEIAVASIFFGLTYEKLADMTLAIRNGARFVATNPDPTLPTERGQVPGTGSLIALLAQATDVEPEFVGKPYPGMFQQAMRKVGTQPEETLMVGDRYETDIVGAIRLGMPTVGVLTGVTTREQYETIEPKPDFILEGLPELLARFKEADA
ncbi:HAD-IIA family hydrolase [Litorilinea aerophila]|uniref:HAD-IIA family hydrolase n=1 Tax=Litorilinea aerophila TaxID=1204385 RepID=A0A540VKW5_9CHLR|nr:HAD-IIA family hydrolase [Litorilinea aerophila]MCC9075094.1 HAD-IIA family hydrolase [Litorilinea aerophila]GIV79883.1 MAG: acid sugar phosphatase [Litorilinea sp.]